MSDISFIVSLSYILDRKIFIVSPLHILIMRFRFFFLLFMVACGIQAQQKDTLFVSDYGISPYSFENQTKKMQSVIRDCKRLNAKVIVFDKGRYDFWPEDAIRKEYFITNTSTEQECPSKEKTIGLLFEGMKGVTVEGNGAALVFHGKMTTVALEHCQRMKLKNFSIDFQRPGGSEMTYTKIDENGVEVKLHRDSYYEISDGRLHLYGEGWRSNRNHCIEYSPDNGHFFYSQGWSILAESPVVEVAPGIVRFSTPLGFTPHIGNTLTIRDVIRDQVGIFILESQHIIFENIGVYYMHGLGIVSQYSQNISMINVRCTPRENSGRILASSADFMHFSGCSGKINILNCQYEGAQDDAINIHGTNLQVIEKINDKSLILKFMHGQSYGFNAFFPGDTIAFVKATTMRRFSYSKVESVRRLSDRTVEIVLDRSVPKELELNQDCIENMTCTPEVEIRGCYFTRTSARGTLVTTPRRVVIADNTYYKIGMSAILIESDAKGWYESGPVKDVKIENNTFIGCAYNGGPGNAVIALNPSNSHINADLPVHQNIRIIGNKFQTQGTPVLYAKSTGGLLFENNEVKLIFESPDVTPHALFILNGCKNVQFKQNVLPKSCSISNSIRLDNMKKKAVMIK